MEPQGAAPDLGYDQLGARWETARDLVRAILSAPDRTAVLRSLREAAGLLAAWRRCEVCPGEGSGAPEGPDAQWAVTQGRAAVRDAGGGRTRILAPVLVDRRAAAWLVMEADTPIEEIPPALLSDLQFLTDQAAFSLASRGLFEEVETRRRAVEEGQALLHNILEGLPHGVLTVSREGTVTQINRNMMMMFELTDEAWAGRPLDQVFPASVAGPMRELVDEALQTGFGMDRMVEHSLSGGTQLDYGLGASVARDAAGMSQGVVIQCRDMTATRELERLRRLDQMKSEFVNNVSHELRTPLTSIKAYTDALLGMVEDPMQQKFLKVVESESDRLLEMIENLLNVSRIESGKLRLELTPVDSGELARAIEQISRVQSSKHTLLLDVAEGLPTANLDAAKMKEVLINLVSNAVKYSPNGGRVWLRASVREGNLVYEVQDEGLGISEENQKHLFEKFFRVDSEATRHIPGTGLGLAITRSIVQAHGGTLQVASTLGKGSTFTVVLPLRTAAGRAEVDLGTVEESPFA